MTNETRVVPVDSVDEVHRWVWKLVMNTFKAHRDINGTPIPAHANVIAGDIARSVAERLAAAEAQLEAVRGLPRESVTLPCSEQGPQYEGMRWVWVVRSDDLETALKPKDNTHD